MSQASKLLPILILLPLIGCKDQEFTKQSQPSSSANDPYVISVQSKLVNDFAGTGYEISTLVKVYNPKRVNFKVGVKLADQDGFALDQYSFSSNGRSPERFEQLGDTTIFTGVAILEPDQFAAFKRTTASIHPSDY